MSGPLYVSRQILPTKSITVFTGWKTRSWNLDKAGQPPPTSRRSKVLDAPAPWRSPPSPSFLQAGIGSRPRRGPKADPASPHTMSTSVEVRGLREHVLVVLVKLHGLHDLRAGSSLHRCRTPRAPKRPPRLPSSLRTTPTNRKGLAKFVRVLRDVCRRHVRLSLKPCRSALGVRRQITLHGISFRRPTAGLCSQSLGPQLPQRCGDQETGHCRCCE